MTQPPRVFHSEEGPGGQRRHSRQCRPDGPEVDPLTITAIVEVYLQDERSETVQNAKARFQSEPEVQQCYYLTGGTSFILIVVTTDMAAYQALTQRLFEDNDSVNRFRSLIALDRVKTDAPLIIP